MTKGKLSICFPDIAEKFDQILHTCPSWIRGNYFNSKRGVSMETILWHLYKKGYVIRVEREPSCLTQSYLEWEERLKREWEQKKNSKNFTQVQKRN